MEGWDGEVTNKGSSCKTRKRDQQVSARKIYAQLKFRFVTQATKWDALRRAIYTKRPGSHFPDNTKHADAQ